MNVLRAIRPMKSKSGATSRGVLGGVLRGLCFFCSTALLRFRTATALPDAKPCIQPPSDPSSTPFSGNRLAAQNLGLQGNSCLRWQTCSSCVLLFFDQLHQRHAIPGKVRPPHNPLQPLLNPLFWEAFGCTKPWVPRNQVPSLIKMSQMRSH